MAETLLAYDRRIVPQETGWWCGPASTQVVLNGLGQVIAEATLAAEIEAIENPGRGDDRDGTDYIGLIEQVLDRRAPHLQYTAVQMPNDPPTPAQKERFWGHLTRSIVGNRAGVVANIVAPPGNPPRAVKGSVAPPYPRWSTTFHYVSIMGVDDSAGERAVWIPDSAAFGGITGWWCPFDGPGSICSLIPPKGYCYAAAPPSTPAPDPKPEPAQPLSGRDRYATAIIAEGRRRGITARGIVIALATALVESNLLMYANAKVPESLALPHDAVGSDGMSVGLFQQQVVRGPAGWWWGDAATCMDPTRSAGLFYDHLARLDYNDGSRSPGSFAQKIQSSAFPERYDQRYTDAANLYARLLDTTTGDDMAQVPQEQWDRVYRALTDRLPSRSIYRTPGEGPVDTAAGMVLNLDAMSHAEFIERLARLGDPDAIGRIARVAAGQGAVTDEWAVRHAVAMLSEIPEQFLTAYLKKG